MNHAALCPSCTCLAGPRAGSVIYAGAAARGLLHHDIGGLAYNLQWPEAWGRGAGLGHSPLPALQQRAAVQACSLSPRDSHTVDYSLQHTCPSPHPHTPPLLFSPGLASLRRSSSVQTLGRYSRAILGPLHLAYISCAGVNLIREWAWVQGKVGGWMGGWRHQNRGVRWEQLLP